MWLRFSNIILGRHQRLLETPNTTASYGYGYGYGHGHGHGHHQFLASCRAQKRAGTVRSVSVPWNTQPALDPGP